MGQSWWLKVRLWSWSCRGCGPRGRPLRGEAPGPFSLSEYPSVSIAHAVGERGFVCGARSQRLHRCKGEVGRRTLDHRHVLPVRGGQCESGSVVVGLPVEREKGEGVTAGVVIRGGGGC